MAKNEYIDTIKPILYLLKFNGFLPINLKENGKYDAEDHIIARVAKIVLFQAEFRDF